MEKNFSLSKFRIKDKLPHNFLETFGGNGNHSFQDNNNRITHLDKININLKQTQKAHSYFKDIKKHSFPFINNHSINNTKNLKLKKKNRYSLITDMNTYQLKPILNKNFIIIDKNNMNQKLKSKNKLPIPSNPKNQKIISKNYVININNNINNNYQLNLSTDKQNNDNSNEIIKNIKEEFSKMKISNIDSWNSKNTTINRNNSQKTMLTELSDLSCFNPSKKANASNSNNNSLRGEIIDIFSISQESEDLKKIDPPPVVEKEKDSANEKERNQNKKTGDIYIDPENFKLFCKEVEKKLNL